jgi:hypothetical protein
MNARLCALHLWYPYIPPVFLLVQKGLDEFLCVQEDVRKVAKTPTQKRKATHTQKKRKESRKLRAHTAGQFEVNELRA